MILNYLNQKTLLAATSELPQFVRYFILVYKKAYVAQKKYKQAQKWNHCYAILILQDGPFMLFTLNIQQTFI